MITDFLLALQLVSAQTGAPVDPIPECLRALQSTFSARGINVETWRTHTQGLTLDPRVLSQLNAQPEFTLAIWDYMAATVDAERIADGQRLMMEHQSTLEAIRTRYQVDPAVVVAIWGLESNFGRGMGGLPILRSLATLSCAGRRQLYFRRELLAALRITQAGHFAPSQFVGSWAGAFGHTQFMPGTFEGLAVDFDGDGRKDVLNSAVDALASTANYLRNAGWRPGMPWGVEVQLPRTAGATAAITGRRVTHSLSVWTSRHLLRVDGTPLVAAPFTARTTAGLFAPSGADGPVFLVTRNFEAVYRYNPATSYVLAVLHLADRIRGGPAFTTLWPTTDPGLSRAERRELQTLLARRGHAVGPSNGTLTAETRAAVRAEQHRVGMEVTGRPGQKLLAVLRAAVPSTPMLR